MLPPNQPQNNVIWCYGCSYTKYSWPTWADCLGLCHSVFNAGWSGCGNDRIYYLFCQDLFSNKIQPGHRVVIQWTSPLRWDYLLDSGEWTADGNLYQPKMDHWNTVRDYYNIDYEIHRWRNHSESVSSLCKSRGIILLEMSMESADHTRNYIIEDLINIEGDYCFKDNGKDWHPTLLQHYHIGKKISDSWSLKYPEIDKIHDLDLQIRSETIFHNKHWSF